MRETGIPTGIQFPESSKLQKNTGLYNFRQILNPGVKHLTMTEFGSTIPTESMTISVQNERVSAQDCGVEEAGYWNSVYHYAEREREPPLGHFGKLQVINIVHLLNDIARMKGEIEDNPAVSKGRIDHLAKRLHQYADAVRDYQYLTSLAPLPYTQALEKRMSLQDAFPSIGTPFPGKDIYPYDTQYFTLEKKAVQPQDGLRNFLRKVLPSRLLWTEEERRARRHDFAAGQPPGVYSKFLDSLARFIVGTAGGCALIVPMVIMALDPSLTKSLITVSAAVILFALVLSLVFETDNKDTITATATYAAVLVVFVGTSGASGTSAGGA
ncbi:hypothetical protein V8F20_009403 [Naviculisporaceae sp. PSN 640]